MHWYTFFNILFKETFEVHQARLFSWLGPKAKTWFTSSKNIPIFHLPLAIFCANNILNLTKASWSINGKSSSLCVYTFHQLTCKHPLVTMCTWTYDDTWCCATCHCIDHCSKNQFSSCVLTTSHAYFIHIVIFLSTCWHNLIQRQGLHLSRHCQCTHADLLPHTTPRLTTSKATKLKKRTTNQISIPEKLILALNNKSF